MRPSRNQEVVQRTTARLAQREKIKICNDFTHAFTGTGFFNKTFPVYGHTGSGYNRVTSCLMNLALVGSYPHQTLAWEKVWVARGPLPVAGDAAASAVMDGKILFSWTDNSGTGTARESDKVITVAYCLQAKQAVFSLGSGTRDMEQATLEAGIFENKSVATWVAFINKNGDVADSVFTGLVDL